MRAGDNDQQINYKKNQKYKSAKQTVLTEQP